MPPTKYDEKILKNFFNFLQEEVIDTLYKKTYDHWGFAIKSKYIKFCRKCPGCLTYITNQQADYCSYCGSEIEIQKEYKYLIDRAKAQHEFVKTQGTTRPELPLTERKKQDGTRVLKARFCPNCLNSDLDDGTSICNICGQPLYGECKECGETLTINDCFCPSCGEETDFNPYYKMAEARLNDLRNYCVAEEKNGDWLSYPYWSFVCNKMSCSKELEAALMYSRAFIDDDYNIIVYTDSFKAAACISKNKERLLDYIRKSDAFEYNDLDVYVINDIKGLFCSNRVT